VRIRELSTGRETAVALNRAYFLLWLERGLYALAGSGSGPRLALIDPDAMTVREDVGAPPGAYALAGTGYDAGVFVFSRGAERTSIGIDTVVGVWATASDGGELRPMREERQLVFGRALSFDVALKGVMTGGVSPADSELLFVRLFNPPALSSHVRLSSYDYMRETLLEIGRIPSGGIEPDGDWSPGGNRFALPDPGRSVWLLDRRTGAASFIDGVRSGRFIDWNPRGDLIYSGGAVVDPTGPRVEVLLDEATESYGAWSPGGDRLALVCGGTLYLASGFSAEPAKGDGPVSPSLGRRLRLMKELLRDKLITEGEYRDRRGKALAEEDAE
jgi:hypothetical protein